MLPDKLKKAIRDSMAVELENFDTGNIEINAMMRAGMGGAPADLDDEVAAYAEDLLMFLIMQIEDFR